MGRTKISLANRTDRASCRGQARDEDAGVIFCTNFDSEAEFATETHGLARRLADHPFPTQIVTAKTQPRLLADLQVRATSKMLNRLDRDHLDLAKSVLYSSGIPTDWNLDFYGRCRVGRTAFGTDRIPKGWAERCNALDELWLPSEFHREIFAVSGVERSKIRVIPLAVDTQTFCPGRSAVRPPGAPARSFQFLAVADGMLAAGIDIVIRAFVEEFAPDDDVALVLLCPPRRCGDRFMDFETEVITLIETGLSRNVEDVPTMTLVMGSLSDEDRAGFFAASQAFVYPARAEATGQHCLEALSCQLPVIRANWGPLTDFLSDRNSFSITTDGLVEALPDEDELVAGHRWAEPNLESLRDRMREVFAKPKEATRRSEHGRREVVERFDWNEVFPEWIRNFERLLE